MENNYVTKKFIISYKDCNGNCKLQTYRDEPLCDDTYEMMAKSKNYSYVGKFSFESDYSEDTHQMAVDFFDSEVDARMPYSILARTLMEDGSMFVTFEHRVVDSHGDTYRIYIPAIKCPELTEAITDIENGTGIKLIPQDDCGVKFKVNLFGRF